MYISTYLLGKLMKHSSTIGTKCPIYIFPHNLGIVADSPQQAICFHGY
jgi:hypothetical protein